MIEWIVGAVVVGGLLFGREEKTKTNTPFISNRSSLDFLDDNPSLDRDPKYSEWCTQWKHKIDRTRWLPKSLASQIVQEFPPHRDGSAEPEPATDHPRFVKALDKEIKSHNAKFLKDQKVNLRDFFNQVERNPLTDEQMDSCICMDDAVQIVAAAGSGKTSTIVARIGYVLKEELARPEQIVVLAFNVSVREELEARIKERLDDIENIDRVKVKTFNAFGLEVIGKSTGRKPKLAQWAEPGRDIKAISKIVEDLCETDPKFRLDWDMFRTIFDRDIGDWENTFEPRTNSNGGGHILTADGNLVRSDEERMICDYLYFHGVEYEYEKSYEHDSVTEDHSQYHPDFYYPCIGLYHEHFALDADGNAPSHFSGDYVAGVRWKRAFHAEHETQLYETTSHELRNGDGLDQLILELEKRGEVLDLDMSRPSKGPELVPASQLSSTIRTFQQHVKSNDLSHSDLRNAIDNDRSGQHMRQKRFVSLYQRISDEWQRRLRAEESVDFDDMLLMAIKHIESGTFKSPYSMVLTDEFQDVSQARLRLLMALKRNAGPTTNLCVVGDDWQSINRFAGADISVMTGFQETFQHSTQLTLSKTFRCPKVVCDASSKFIQKNPNQIKKRVETSNTYERPLLHAFAMDSLYHGTRRLEIDLRKVFDAAKRDELDMPAGTKVSIMLLGRYHRDRPARLKAWKREFAEQLDINFMTAHASKGLEADYVMLLNVTGESLGFPCQLVDDPLLQLAMPQPDTFPASEERRLFYVALTRARRQTRIYTLTSKPSQFLVELAKDGHLEITSDRGRVGFCPDCTQGTLIQKTGRFGPFESCSTYPECDYTKNIETDGTEINCAAGPVRLTIPISSGAPCPTCQEGTMVVRNGRNDEQFLGCSSFPNCRTTAPYSDLSSVTPVRENANAYRLTDYVDETSG